MTNVHPQPVKTLGDLTGGTDQKERNRIETDNLETGMACICPALISNIKSGSLMCPVYEGCSINNAISIVCM